jgi:hypothetical protein
MSLDTLEIITGMFIVLVAVSIINITNKNNINGNITAIF